jgi:signal transduction histidine kinase
VTLWPRSMVGQLLLAVALTLFAAQSANLWLLARAQRQQFVAQAGGVAAARIIDVLERERVSGVPLDPVAPRRGRVTIGPMLPPPPPGARAAPRLAAYVADVLRDSGMAVQDARAWTLPPRAEVAVFDGRRWISVRGRAPVGSDRLSSLLIGQTLLLYLVLLGPILFIGWRVSRPLNELTASVRRAVPGQSAAALDPRGPADVRDLMAAFNAHRGRIDMMLIDKDRMLGAVGHDLRTPLASLRVRVEQVADAPLRERMIASIDEMTVMLNDILAVARTGAGMEQTREIALGPWLDGLVADYAERGLAVTREAGDDAGQIHGRPVLLGRAVRNLIDNALTYGGRAGVRIARRDGTAAILVSDDGPGIDPARVDELMEAFARGEASRSRDTGGAGLGLAIAKMIAEGEGGALDLRNRAESGLEARIVLPL